MSKAFIYGKMVEGENFTDRVKETRRLKANFEEGINTIVISPRRIGKSSLIKHVKDSIDDPKLKVVMIDIYDCRSEYDFLNRFAAVLMKEAAGKMERVLDTIQKFLVRVVPKVSYSPAPLMDYSISLGITPQNYSPEEILALPEIIAREQGVQIVVCIDEFQQVGEFPDSITVQKRMRGVWQRQQNVSYCMYGSKKHMMEKIFLNRSYPFYRFGDILYLKKISEPDWVSFICERFEVTGKHISENLARQICLKTECYSSYVQQLAWFVWLSTKDEAQQMDVDFAMNRLLDSCEALFIQQTAVDGGNDRHILRALHTALQLQAGNAHSVQFVDIGGEIGILEREGVLTAAGNVDTVGQAARLCAGTAISAPAAVYAPAATAPLPTLASVPTLAEPCVLLCG